MVLPLALLKQVDRIFRVIVVLRYYNIEFLIIRISIINKSFL